MNIHFYSLKSIVGSWICLFLLLIMVHYFYFHTTSISIYSFISVTYLGLWMAFLLTFKKEKERFLNIVNTLNKPAAIESISDIVGILEKENSLAARVVWLLLFLLVISILPISVGELDFQWLKLNISTISSFLKNDWVFVYLYLFFSVIYTASQHNSSLMKELTFLKVSKLNR